LIKGTFGPFEKMDPLKIDIILSKELIKVLRLWVDKEFVDKEFL
jgi:hypothetical protein